MDPESFALAQKHVGAPYPWIMQYGICMLSEIILNLLIVHKNVRRHSTQRKFKADLARWLDGQLLLHFFLDTIFSEMMLIKLIYEFSYKKNIDGQATHDQQRMDLLMGGAT
ncbi:hypothetical protein ACJX0J_017783, partial [Zea mays]